MGITVIFLNCVQIKSLRSWPTSIVCCWNFWVFDIANLENKFEIWFGYCCSIGPNRARKGLSIQLFDLSKNKILWCNTQNVTTYYIFCRFRSRSYILTGLQLGRIIRKIKFFVPLPALAEGDFRFVLRYRNLIFPHFFLNAWRYWTNF